jgi:hypothetical protein
MNCPHCGAKMSKHAKNCPECGAPRDLPVDERTTILQREPIEEQMAEPEVETEVKTVRMPQMPSAEPAPEPIAAPEPEPAPVATPEPEPEPRKRSLLPIIVVVAALAIAAALFALNTCNKPASEPRPSKPVEEPSAYQTDEGEAEVSPADSRANGPDEAAVSDDQGGEDEQDGAAAADDGATEVDQATLDGWSETARAALTVYPSNHVLAGGADDEPSELSLESWTDSLMQYVDSSSALGQALLDDPEAVATPLGFFEAASYVSSTEVTDASAEGVNVTVTLEATQMDWSMTSTVTEQYLVKFNSDGLITDIVSVG